MRTRMTYVFLAVLLGATTLAAQGFGQWTAAGQLTAARAGHTVTRLADGRLLVAGGEGSTGLVGVVELFNPATGVSQSAGFLASPRKNQAAVLLQDGRVLLTGGEGAGVLDTTEVYNPATQSFVAVGRMAQARRYHTATLLDDGSVLIAGGNNGVATLASLERFHPATGQFESLAAALPTPREQHTATLLVDGRVLIVGGRNGSGALASTAYFTPSTQTVAAGLTLAQGRYAHTATRLMFNSVAVVGGTDGTTVRDTAEMIFPDENLVGESANRLQVGRYNHVAVLLPQNENLLVLGGRSATGPAAAVEMFHALRYEFSSMASLANARAEFAAAAEAGRLCVVGGRGSGDLVLAGVECYGVSTIASEHIDYPANSTVSLRGSGWQPGETVQIQITKPGNEPATDLNAVADGQGRIQNSAFSTTANDAGLAFNVTATGVTSGRLAFTTFYDSHSLSCMTSPGWPGCPIPPTIPTMTQTPSPVPLTIFGSSFTFFCGGALNEVFMLGPGTPPFPGASLGFSSISNTSINTTIPASMANLPGAYSVVVRQTPTFLTFLRCHLHCFFGFCSCHTGNHCFGGFTHFSNSLPLTINPACIAPSVTVQPSNQTVAVGGNATFNAAASGSPTPTVQWQVSTNGGATFSNIPGATSTTLIVPSVTLAQNGNKYRAVFTNTCGTGTSFPATLTVVDNIPPTVTCPAPITALADGSGQAPIPNLLPVPASDNVTPAASLLQTQSPGAGTLVGVGAHTITVTVTDQAGNSATCSTTFTVVDDTPPTVACPAPITAFANGSGQAAVPNLLPVPASDNVTPAASLLQTQNPAAGTLVGVGIHTIVVIVTDQAGNVATCSTTFTVVVPDLAVSKSASSSSVTNGSNLTYTITVTNIGTGAASNVVLTEPLPSGTTFVSASAGCSASGATVTCNLGTLAPGGPPITVTVVVKVSAPVGTNLVNTASATTTTPEINTGNNSGPASVTVINSPPSVSRNNASVTVNEGATAVNTGGFSDPDPGDTVTLSASIGGVTPSGAGWSWSFGTTDGPAQSQTVTITATDNHGASSIATFSLVVNNVAPTVSFNISANPIPENGSISLSGGISDPGILDSHTVVIDWGDGSATTGLSLAAGILSFSATHQYLDDNPTATSSDVYPITVTVTDKDLGTGTANGSITVNNVAPAISGVTGPSNPLPLGAAATVGATFTDVGTQDAHTCAISWDDGTSSAGSVTETGGNGSCSASRTYTAAGVYTVTMTVTDDDTGVTSSVFQFIVVYDPNAGFVTGGGWINSPAGAYTADPTLAGKATFGFVSKYLPGRTIPSGNTEFQFHTAGFNFKSTVYEWLVIAGVRAQYKGSGTINGGGDYGFLLTATDGDLTGGGGFDKFRIKIVNKSTGTVIYDNTPGSDDIDTSGQQAIAQGSIVIHKK